MAFDLKVKIAGQDVRASGTTYIGSDGKVTTEDRAETRDFGASGHLADGRLSATLNGEGGRRMGTLKLELINR